MSPLIHVLLGTKAELIKVAPVMDELDRRDIVGKFFGSEESRLLIENGVSPRYVRSGHLLFVREIRDWSDFYSSSLRHRAYSKRYCFFFIY